jgi:hypothetical protein
VAFGTFTARAFSVESTVFVAWQEDGRRTLCRLSGSEEREAAEAVARGDCEAVRRICRSAVRVQLALGGPGTDVWGSAGALEWQPESEEVVGSAIAERQPESESADEWQLEPMDVSEWKLEPSVWQPESERKNDISKSVSAQESHPDRLDFKEDLKWPDDFELNWPEDQEFQVTPAAAEIEEAVQYLREDVTESVRQVNEEWAKRLPKRAKWADAGKFVEWHSSVASGADGLAEDVRKIEEATARWRYSGGALSWWKRDRTWERQETEAWKRHSTPGEMRKMRIRGQRARDEKAKKLFPKSQNEETKKITMNRERFEGVMNCERFGRMTEARNQVTRPQTNWKVQNESSGSWGGLVE